MAKIKIVNAIVDEERLTLYKEDGTTIEIKQGDPRVRKIVSQITEPLSRGERPEIDVDGDNPYKDFEEKSESGVVKFFRVLKKHVAHIFGTKQEEFVPPQVLGSLNVKETKEPLPETNSLAEEKPEAPPSKIASAVQEIIDRATPVADEVHITKPEEDPHHTIIAVVDNETVIPGVEKMSSQFKHAAKIGSTKGVENFFKRLKPVMARRKHSVEDILKFMERGDLPIADDGCIVAYKKLYRKENGAYFVDPHTQKVKQKVGSYVCVDESLVDPNKHNECSNGLHIGRRQYMPNFSGDTIMICKIPPENVIAVPHGDPNKVRVCGYHIVGELSDAEFRAICSNQGQMTDVTDGRKRLAQVIAGDHIDRIEEVRITQQKGGGLIITPLEGAKVTEAPVITKATPQAKAIPEPKEKPRKEAAKLDPKKVAEKVVATKAKTERELLVESLLNKLQDNNPAIAYEGAKGLFDLKKKSKVSYINLGVKDPVLCELIQTLVDKGAPKREVVSAAVEPDPADAIRTTYPDAKKPKAKKTVKSEPKPIKEKDTKVETKTEEAPAQVSEKVQKARAMFEKKDWGGLWTMQKAAKKGWPTFGFTPAEIERIKTNKPDWV